MNMGETLTEKLTGTPQKMRLYQQERAILEMTEIICELMQEQNVTRSELAKRLGTTKGYITQLLDGRTNMSIRTMSDVFAALDRSLHFQEGPLEATVSSHPVLSLALEGGVDWGDRSMRWPEMDGIRVQDGPNDPQGMAA
jgi:transcriptional regulator with XRE-family HTH domain